MKIAIFHNLQDGGGYLYFSNLVSELLKLNHIIDIYTHQKTQLKNVRMNFYYPLKVTNNIVEHVKQVLIETDLIEKEIALKIIENSYDYIFIFPCHLQQTPNITKYLPKKITFYFYLESLREFYEKTSFNYYSFSQILSRAIRYPIKIQDRLNCYSIENIISDSYYSEYTLKKIYNKKSIVVQPGIKYCLPKKLTKTNDHKSLSFGILTMLKGHHISAQIDPNVKIFGKKAHESLPKNIERNKVKQRYVFDKNKLYLSHTFYLANQINEPFGLTTLEACNKNLFLFGRNEAGTSEIINVGNNGYLYNPSNIKLAIKLFKYINSKSILKYTKTNYIDWENTADKILDIIKYG